MSTVENVFLFFRSPHLETHTKNALDNLTHAHTLKKTEKKKTKEKVGCISVTAVFDAKKNAESQNAKRTFERSEHHCFMKRTLIEQ